MPVIQPYKRKPFQMLLSEPALQEQFKGFDQFVGAPPPAPEPTRPAPRFTSREEYEELTRQPDMMAMLEKLAPQRKVESEEYHQKQARLDALGRAIGSLGGFVSAHKGGPVPEAPPGRSREHMDRYEQLLLDYQQESRAHDLLALQELIRSDREFAQIALGERQAAEQIPHRDYEYERERGARREDIEEARAHEKEMLPLRTEEQKKIMDYQHKLQLSRDAQAALLSQKAAGQFPADMKYSVSVRGANYPVDVATAMSLFVRMPDDDLRKIFGATMDEFDRMDDKMQLLLARAAQKGMIMPKAVEDKQGNVVGYDLGLRTKAEKQPTLEETGETLAQLAIRVREGDLSEGELPAKVMEFVDEIFGYNMELHQEAELAASKITYGILEYIGRRDPGRNPMREIPFYKNWGAPEGMERNLYDLMRHHVEKLEKTPLTRGEARKQRGAEVKAKSEKLLQEGVPAGRISPQTTGQTVRGAFYRR